MLMLNILTNRLPIKVYCGSYYSQAYFEQPSPASMQRTCQIIEQLSAKKFHHSCLAGF